MTRSVNSAAQALIKQWESLELVVYKDQAGLPTVGWGHRTTLPVGTAITQSQADMMFEYDIDIAATCLCNAFDQTQVNDNQFGALVSFVFNIGTGNFLLAAQGGSKVLKALRAGNFDGVPPLLKQWNHVTLPSGTKVESQGLANRRQAECVLYETPPDEPQLNMETDQNG